MFHALWPLSNRLGYVEVLTLWHGIVPSSCIMALLPCVLGRRSHRVPAGTIASFAQSVLNMFYDNGAVARLLQLLPFACFEAVPPVS
jgi:hypothetical protein